MSVKQTSTFYDNFSIKSYTESIDGEEILYKEYDEKGRMILFREKNNEWHKWIYNDNDKCNKVLYTSFNGHWSKRHYDILDRMIYAENQNGTWVKYEYYKDTNEITNIITLEPTPINHITIDINNPPL